MGLYYTLWKKSQEINEKAVCVKFHIFMAAYGF